MDTNIPRLLKMKKYIFWVNAHATIDKQSNEVWNTHIHLKNNSPSIKVPLNLWFLIMTFNLCFYHQLWVKWVYIHTGNRSGHTIFDVRLKIQDFNPPPPVFVCPETGNPLPVGRPKQTLPVPKLCYRPSTKVTQIKKIHLYFSESQKNQMYLKNN